MRDAQRAKVYAAEEFVRTLLGLLHEQAIFSVGRPD